MKFKKQELPAKIHISDIQDLLKDTINSFLHHLMRF